MQSFRASPWVSYEPSLHTQDLDQDSGSEMDEDIDMEAPQISTLREEESPPPHKKAAVNSKKRPRPNITSGEPWKRVKGADDVDDEEDQVDELIDDDGNGNATKALRSTDAAQKRKASSKRKPRKSEKKVGETEKKTKDMIIPTIGQVIAPTISIFKANPTDLHEDMTTNSSTSLTALQLADSSPGKGKKKTSPQKPAMLRATGKVPIHKPSVSHLLEPDVGILSESYPGTAASSPVTAPFEQNSPEPENLPPSSPVFSSVPLVEEPPSLENVPIPVYPLPTKPFPVQPPQKIATGFAPMIPLDKSRKRARHWREANREIRGIAGGRWLTRTWVGDKESELASHVVAKSVDDKSAGAVLSKTPSHPLSGVATSKAVSKLKATSKSGSVANSSSPSRAQSAGPDTNAVTSTVRAPTKMRISQQAPESDVDLVASSGV